MVISYVFDEGFFDYEVEFEDYEDALKKIIMKCWSLEDCVDYLISCQGCVIDLFKDFEEELKDYFKNDAYAQFRENQYD